MLHGYGCAVSRQVASRGSSWPPEKMRSSLMLQTSVPLAV